MLRTILLVALLLAGAGSGPGPRTLADQASTAIGAGDAAGFEPVLRSSGPALSAPWEQTPGSTPRTAPRDGGRPDPSFFSHSPPAAALVALRARWAAHRGCADPLALARSGRLSNRSTAPPPLRLV